MYLNNTLFRTAQLWPDRTAIATSTRRATWAETLERVRRLAGSLGRLAPGAHDRVALLGLNSAEYLELTLAVPLTGRPMVTLNYRLAYDELSHMLAECPVAVLCFDAAMTEMARRLKPLIRTAMVFWGPSSECPDFARPYEALVADGVPVEPPQLSQTDVWAVVPSGGTTGMPKSVEISHGGMAFNVASTLDVLDLGSEPRGLHVSPLFHLAGFACSYALTGKGGTHSFLPQFSIEGLLRGLEEHRCTVTNLVPTMINWLVASDEIRKHDLSNLRNILYGAAAIGLPTLRRLLELFPDIQVNQFYGQTEASGALACLLAEDHVRASTRESLLRSAGRPLPGVRIEILDANGLPLPRGEAGEICAQTDAMFIRYFGHEKATAEAKRGGWLHTGDVGYLDEEGYLYVTDRLKDMIVTGGENVSASEVENVLACHPSVVQVAVVAAPDVVWGERIHAFVVTGERDPVDAAELERLCRTRLAAYKIPRSMTIQTDPLPLSGAGKIRKDLLRQMARAHADG